MNQSNSPMVFLVCSFRKRQESMMLDLLKLSRFVHELAVVVDCTACLYELFSFFCRPSAM